MPSSYTANTGIEKPATGEQSGVWGETVNTNSDILDRALNGVGTIDLSGSGAAHTLTTTDGALSDGQYRVLVLFAATEACTITVSPNDAQKVYFVNNTSGFDCTFSQGSGSSVTISNGQTGVIYADGGGASAAVVAIAEDLSDLLVSTNNLSDLADAPTALTNLGVTATAAELNVLDGITATTAELNILDGVTATTAEINYNDITTLGTSEASKVVTADANGVVIFDAGVVEDETAITSSTGAATINCQDGNVFTHTLSEDVTYTFSNPPASGRAFGFTLKVVQDATARTITWPASVDWPGGTAPTLSTGSGEVDVFVFFTHDGGTTFYGFTAGQVMS